MCTEGCVGGGGGGGEHPNEDSVGDENAALSFLSVASDCVTDEVGGF